MTRTNAVIGCAVLALLGVSSASAQEKSPSITYENTIKALTGERCVACHGSDSPSLEEFDKDKEGFKKKSKGPRMDSYERLIVFVNGTDAGALMRRLDDGKNTADRKPGNMNMFLGGTDQERAANLAKFKKWVGSWNLKRRKELSDAELKAITAPR